MNRITKQEMLTYLKSKQPRYFTAFSVLSDSDPTDLLLQDDAFFIRTKNDTGHFVFCSLVTESEDAIALLMAQLQPEDTLFCTYSNKLAARLHDRYTISVDSDCKQLILPDTVPVCEDEEGIIDLKDSDAAYIHTHYEMRHVLPVSYIRDRINAGPAIGVIVNDVLAGWVMTHDERTMGVLEVLPAFRRMGLASKLNGAMVRRMRKLGLPCMVEILKDNDASLALAAATGFEYLQDVHWLIAESELKNRQSATTD